MYVSDVFRLAETNIFNRAGDRQGYQNTAVIISDRYPNEPSTLQKVIVAIHSNSIRIFVHGVTDRVDETTLGRL